MKRMSMSMILAALAAGCGGGATPWEPDADADAEPDATADSDVSADAEPDTDGDAVVDAATDAAVDGDGDGETACFALGGVWPMMIGTTIGEPEAPCRVLNLLPTEEVFAVQVGPNVRCGTEVVGGPDDWADVNHLLRTAQWSCTAVAEGLEGCQLTYSVTREDTGVAVCEETVELVPAS